MLQELTTVTGRKDQTSSSWPQHKQVNSAQFPVLGNALNLLLSHWQLLAVLFFLFFVFCFFFCFILHSWYLHKASSNQLALPIDSVQWGMGGGGDNQFSLSSISSSSSQFGLSASLLVETSNAVDNMAQLCLKVGPRPRYVHSTLLAWWILPRPSLIFGTLLLPCITVNANRRAKNWVGKWG